MEAKTPRIVIEGIEHVIERDLEKNKSLLDRAKLELEAFRQARSHEIAKRKHYKAQIGGGKFDDDALRRSMGDIAVNIRHFSDKIQTTQRKIELLTRIVDNLTDQLTEQNAALAFLAKHRRDNALSHGLGEPGN